MPEICTICPLYIWMMTRISWYKTWGKTWRPCLQEAGDCRGQICTNSHQWCVSSKNVKLRLRAGEEQHISIMFVPSGTQQHLSTVLRQTCSAAVTHGLWPFDLMDHYIDPHLGKCFTLQHRCDLKTNYSSRTNYSSGLDHQGWLHCLMKTMSEHCKNR